METKRNTLIDKIEKDKHTDKLIKRVCYGSWGMLFLITITNTFLIFNQYLMPKGKGIWALQISPVSTVGNNGYMDAIWTITIPFIGPFIIFLFVGILSSIAILVRMRTSSLRDIQLRLGTLESALLSDD